MTGTAPRAHSESTGHVTPPVTPGPGTGGMGARQRDEVSLRDVCVHACVRARARASARVRVRVFARARLCASVPAWVRRGEPGGVRRRRGISESAGFSRGGDGAVGRRGQGPPPPPHTHTHTPPFPPPFPSCSPPHPTLPPTLPLMPPTPSHTPTPPHPPPLSFGEKYRTPPSPPLPCPASHPQA